jgi:hypothetical protein
MHTFRVSILPSRNTVLGGEMEEEKKPTYLLRSELPSLADANFWDVP